MTLGAVMKDIATELKYLGDWHRFPRVAVLASGGFVKSAAEIFGKVLPQVQVRTFQPGELKALSSSQAASIPARISRTALQPSDRAGVVTDHLLS